MAKYIIREVQFYRLRNSQTAILYGEKLSYTIRKKKELTALFRKKQKELIGGFPKEDLPVTWQEYCVYYRGMEHMPFAFADIEMVFNEKMQAVDWIFCYGNPALASLEKFHWKI